MPTLRRLMKFNIFTALTSRAQCAPASGNAVARERLTAEHTDGGHAALPYRARRDAHSVHSYDE
jgi:hypothetical protein